MSSVLEPIKDTLAARQSELTANQPGILKTIKRNGQIVRYDEDKIKVAITKAFIAVEGSTAATSNRIHQQINDVVQQVTQTFKRRLPSGGTLHIEDIQDLVELALMRSSQYKIARAYVLYREERRKARDTVVKQGASDDKILLITQPNGDLKPLDINRINTIVAEACRDLAHVDAEPVIKDALRNLYNQATVDDVYKALIMSARSLVETEPNYSFVSARLLTDTMRREALTKLNIQQEATFDEMAAL